ncbi:DUF1611 domain-containing protein [Sphingosinicella sp.]|uniref:DUF1611 domain-containing protein n=1 Tax=Sphingosinicella sp. TaxID=1917971 RepID=UPI0017BEFB85|nr:DUF1611 domain-containing protein [Sphingosinicella sp.]MBA4758924.1 DUF1611 domain-containing protein [Sphingosinicella sp.]
MVDLPSPYLLFLGDTRSETYAKTAFGLRDWAPDAVIGEYAMPEATVTLGLERLTPTAAASRGARALLLGIAPVGGAIPAHWLPELIAALEAGLDIVAGLHQRLADIPELAATARRLGRTLFDVRHPTVSFSAGTGLPRSGKRLLTVGTDCALGKKYTALAIAKRWQALGGNADFRATGQTGIMIAGHGVAIDAVVADFIAGAAEWLSPANAPDHWDIIEGQGSLYHPAFAGVTLGLLHGAQPDLFVLCHDPTRAAIYGYPHIPMPDLAEAIALYTQLGRLTNPAIACAGISINSSKMGEADRADWIARTADRLGLPVADPLRDGVDGFIQKMQAVRA